MIFKFVGNLFLQLAMAVGFALLVFQNCSRIAPPGDTTIPPTTVDLPFNHPDVVIAASDKSVAGQILIGDKDFLESVFNDIFAASGASAGVQNYVTAVVAQEFAGVQSALGRPCDVYTTGDGSDCNGVQVNLNLQMNAQSSSLREAARIQICRRLLANNDVLAYVVSRVKGDQNTPNAESMAAAFQLFFPARDVATEIMPALLNMDKQLALESQSVNDRWRLLFLALCESPAWQVL